jgi:hypothetical protein
LMMSVISTQSWRANPLFSICRPLWRPSTLITQKKSSDGRGISDYSRGCHRFYYLAPFTVFDSFSHPFLPCKCRQSWKWN